MTDFKAAKLKNHLFEVIIHVYMHIYCLLVLTFHAAHRSANDSMRSYRWLVG